MVNQRARLFIAITLSPIIIMFMIAYLIPMTMMIITSFLKWDSLRIEGFIGLGNYARIFTSSVERSIFVTSITNSLSWSAFAVFVRIPLALLAAIILNKGRSGWKVFRTLIFIPHVISITAIAMIFKQVFNPSFGLLHGLLGALGLEDLAKTNWLFDPRYAWWAIISTWVFHIGFFAVIFMAELTAIPAELYESAEIEGASHSQQTFRITLPLMRNIIGSVIIMDVLAGLRYFEGIFLMTDGAPNYKTETLALYIYQKVRIIQYGYANALGVMLLVFGLLIVLLLFRAFRIGESNY